MEDESSTQAGNASVLGNLPRKRPGRRSPRRDGEPVGGKRSYRAAPGEPASKRRRDAGPPQGGAGESRGDAGPPQGGAGEGAVALEDLVWAGIAIAAEAATIAIRALNRALEAGAGRPGRSG